MHERIFSRSRFFAELEVLRKDGIGLSVMLPVVRGE
jgi:hypothetical protein